MTDVSRSSPTSQIADKLPTGQVTNSEVADNDGQLADSEVKSPKS